MLGAALYKGGRQSKKPSSNRRQAIVAIPRKRSIPMTGTPVENTRHQDCYVRKMLLSPRIFATVAAVWWEGSSSHQSSKLSEWIGHANPKGAFITRFIGHLFVCFVECEARPKLVFG